MSFISITHVISPVGLVGIVNSKDNAASGLHCIDEAFNLILLMRVKLKLDHLILKG